ncbi:hypothetical protein EDD86DRAFT_273449 [Gorgonomyces haynaldii]|nr:hypothetical protein EDD86DRAFT_273449 [Gorgonomyces haynaldii]
MWSLSTTELKIRLAPCFISQEKQGIHQYLQSMLFKYNQQLQGVIVAFANVKVTDSFAKIQNESPFMNMNIQVDLVHFSPKKEQLLVGIVNKMSADHIGLLVHGIFNASISTQELEGWEWQEDHWSSGQMAITENCAIKFKVVSLSNLNGLFSIHGTLQDGGLLELEEDQQPPTRVVQETEEYAEEEVQVVEEEEEAQESEDSSDEDEDPSPEEEEVTPSVFDNTNSMPVSVSRNILFSIRCRNGSLLLRKYILKHRNSSSWSFRNMDTAKQSNNLSMLFVKCVLANSDKIMVFGSLEQTTETGMLLECGTSVVIDQQANLEINCPLPFEVRVNWPAVCPYEMDLNIQDSMAS